MKKLKTLMLDVNTTTLMKSYEEITISSITSYLREKGYNIKMLKTQGDLENIQEIVDLNPDIIGIPVYIINIEVVFKVVKKLREFLPNTIIGVNGFLATFYWKEILGNCKGIDFAVKGDGEIIWSKILSCIEKGDPIKDIPGIAHRYENHIIENDECNIPVDMKSLPHPARDMIKDYNLKVAQIATSRGCRGYCTYCPSKALNRVWRGRDAIDIVNELEDIVDEFGIKVFKFVDSSFEDYGECYDNARLVKIVNEIINRDLNIMYTVFMRSDFYKHATPELMYALRQSGLINVFVGIDTGNLSDCKLYNKEGNPKEAEKTLRLFKKYDIATSIGFINFNPYSSFDTLSENIDFLYRNNLAYNMESIISLCKVLKGTSLYKKAKSDNLIIKDSFQGFDYRFVDSRIGKLQKYLYHYVALREGSSRCFNSIMHINSTSSFVFPYLKKSFDADCHRDAYNTIIEHEKKYDETCVDLNGRVTNMFKELLLIAESNWDEQAADNVFEEYFSPEYLRKIAKNMIRQNDIMFKNIIKIKPEYKKVFDVFH